MAFDFSEQQIRLTECYKIILEEYNVTAYFTRFRRNLVFQGNTYQAVPIQRDSIKYNSDLTADKVNIQMGLVGVILGSQSMPMYSIVRAGFLKNAHIYIYLVDPLDTTQYQLDYEGWINGDIAYTKGTLTVTCGSILEKLRDKFPRLIYSAECNHALFDTYCGLTKATWAHTGTCAAGTTNQKIYCPTLFTYSQSAGTHEEGYWQRGELVMTSGLNEDIARSVLYHSSLTGFVYLQTPYWFNVEVGDTFTIYPGCDKSGACCNDRFANYANFLGFEYIPTSDVLFGVL